jgi:hypothetical protein
VDVLPEAAGPQDAVTAAPRRSPGSIRRTTNIDTLRPDGLGADAVVDARARDLRTNLDGTSDVVATATLQARISPTHELLSIRTSPEVPALCGLLGASVGAGFRSRFNEIVTGAGEEGTPLYLLLDDLAGATLVSGYALHRGGALDKEAVAGHARAKAAGPPAKAPSGPPAKAAGPAAEPAAGPGPAAEPVAGPFPVLGAQGDICAGWAHDATMMVHVRGTGSLPVPLGPPAPILEWDDDPLSWHVMGALTPHAVRRRRRLDLVAPPAGAPEHRIDLHFRDSHVDDRGSETIMHEYTLSGSVDLRLGRIGTLSARANVLPWVECPGALASVRRVDGMELSELRYRIRKEFVGRSTCTHLNDSLRSLADVTALHRALTPSA